MARVKILREEFVDHGNQVMFEVETWGELHLMPRKAQEVAAIFGHFQRINGGTLLYSLWADEDSPDIGHYDSMYLDDLHCLRSGNVEIVERRAQ